MNSKKLMMGFIAGFLLLSASAAKADNYMECDWAPGVCDGPTITDAVNEVISEANQLWLGIDLDSTHPGYVPPPNLNDLHMEIHEFSIEDPNAGRTVILDDGSEYVLQPGDEVIDGMIFSAE